MKTELLGAEVKTKDMTPNQTFTLKIYNGRVKVYCDEYIDNVSIDLSDRTITLS